MRGTVTPDRTAARASRRTDSQPLQTHTNPLPIMAMPFSSFVVCGMRYDRCCARWPVLGPAAARGGFRTNSHGRLSCSRLGVGARRGARARPRVLGTPYIATAYRGVRHGVTFTRHFLLTLVSASFVPAVNISLYSVARPRVCLASRRPAYLELTQFP